jgi:hypothetical protein
VSTDLVQIAGRQRLESNPFRKYISLFYTTNRAKEREEDYQIELDRKLELTREEVECYKNSIYKPNLRVKQIEDLKSLQRVQNFSKSYTYYDEYKVTFAYSVKGTSADYDLVIDTSRVVTKVVYTSTGSSSILGKPQYTFTTKGDKVEKVLVLKNFQIPERYFYSSKTGSAAELINSIGFSIKVINATTKAEVNKPETAKFTRNIKIDCLILEPVQ